MRWSVFWVLFIWFYGSMIGQNFVHFKDESFLLKDKNQTRGFLPSAFTDYNGDYIDDLILFDEGRRIVQLLGNPYHKTLLKDRQTELPHYFDSFALLVADLNKDGIGDIITGGSFGYLYVLLSENDTYENIKLPTDFLVQTINVADLNEDGYPDIFVCNDDGPNVFYMNQSGQSFIQNNNIIDFSTIPVSDMSGNYGSVWVDVNQDKLPDLAISKCRAGVSSPADPRRINTLYINDGNGSYMNKAPAWKFDLGQQSWATVFGDFDNDGDYDAFVVNHYEPHVLLENIEGERFQQKTFSPAPLSGFAFQVAARDFDNDGLLDIVMSGLDGLIFLHNQGNLQFKIITQTPLPLKGMSISIGDINDDGFCDIHAQLNESLNFPSATYDRIYVNQKNNNHFIKYNLLPGKNGNSVIGTTVEIYGPFGQQTRQLHSGEGYGITNSAQIHFGLGQNTKVDSLKVFWPSGITETHYDMLADHTYFLQEGGCKTERVLLSIEAALYDATQEIKIEAPPGYLHYKWNTGEENIAIWTTSPQQFFVIMKDSLDCLTYSYPSLIYEGCFPIGTNVLGEAEALTICKNQPLNLTSTEAVKYIWSTGDTSKNILVQEPGLYSITATDNCGNKLIDSLHISFVESHGIIVEYPDSLQKNRPGICTSNSSFTDWFSCAENIWLATGDTFQFSIKNQDTCFVARSFVESETKSATCGITSFPALNQFGSNTINGALQFDVNNTLKIKSVDVFTDTPGKRAVIIKNNVGIIIFQKEFQMIFGKNTLLLNAEIPMGQGYSMTTDNKVNLEQLGFDGPRFLRHTGGGLNFPFSIQGVVDIYSSNFGQNNYYYFYNWKVAYDKEKCYGEEIQMYIRAVQSTATDDHFVSGSNLILFPNPGFDYVKCTLRDEIHAGQIHVYNAFGQKVLQQNVNQKEFTVKTDTWVSGLYFFELTFDKEVHRSKFFKN